MEKNLSTNDITLVDNFLEKTREEVDKEKRITMSVLELFQPKFRLTFFILSCC